MSKGGFASFSLFYKIDRIPSFDIRLRSDGTLAARGGAHLKLGSPIKEQLGFSRYWLWVELFNETVFNIGCQITRYKQLLNGEQRPQ